jgi:hypothetical protein
MYVKKLLMVMMCSMIMIGGIASPVMAQQNGDNPIPENPLDGEDNPEGWVDNYTVDKTINGVTVDSRYVSSGKFRVYLVNTNNRPTQVNIQEFRTMSKFDMQTINIQANEKLIVTTDNANFAYAVISQDPQTQQWSGQYVYKPVLGFLDIPKPNWYLHVVAGFAIVITMTAVGTVYYYYRIERNKINSWRSIYDMELWRY